MAVILALTAVAVAVRLYDLGALGFFGDEETTAFAARALAEGRGSEMPSGMPYRRALPFTWLNAVSASLFGLDGEFAYRVPAALMGALTVPLLYFVTASIAGPGAGLFAALLLALSGWHLVWSRMARMYAPVLLVALAFFYFIWSWQRSGRGRELAAAFLLYLLAVFLHSAAGAIALFPILFSLLYDGSRVRARNGVSVALLMAAAGWLLDRLFVVAPYERWASDFSAASSAPAGQLAGSLQVLFGGLPAAAVPLLAAGLLVGGVGARNAGVFASGRGQLTTFTLTSLAGFAVATGFAGLPGAAAVFGIAALLLDGRGWRPWWSPRWAVVAVIGTAIGTAVRLAGSEEGIRGIAMTPFPYLPYLGRLLPILVLVFGLAALWMALRVSGMEFDDRPLRASALFVLGYCLALGFTVDWAPWRYLLIVYPWILIVAAFAIWHLTQRLAAKVPHPGETFAGVLVGIAIASGLIGGHGVPATSLVLRADYGTSIPWSDAGMEIRPDHEEPGRFVREHLRPGDIVIAEDALEQRWYVGRVDRWFRSFDDARKFLYRDESGVDRDIYVGAMLQAEPPDSAFLSRTDAAVWVITSGETALSRGWYLSQKQAGWLEFVERTVEPAFRGGDGLSAVYCFGRCPPGIGTESSREIEIEPLLTSR